MNATITTAELANVSADDFHWHNFTARLTPQFTLQVTAIGATMLHYKQISNWGGPTTHHHDNIADLSIVWDVTPALRTARI